MSKDLYIVTLNCGDRVRMNLKEGDPKPRQGGHATCPVCHEVGTIQSVTHIYIAIGNVSASVEEA
jgi:hypothetical protein